MLRPELGDVSSALAALFAVRAVPELQALAEKVAAPRASVEVRRRKPSLIAPGQKAPGACLALVGRHALLADYELPNCECLCLEGTMRAATSVVSHLDRAMTDRWPGTPPLEGLALWLDAHVALARPLCILLEDLGDADALTVQGLALAAAASRRGPVTVCVTVRRAEELARLGHVPWQVLSEGV
jgi:hypothetical protein